MAKASDLIGGGDGFAALPSDASFASGSGWLIDPDLNLNGVNVHVIAARADGGSLTGYLGSNKGTPTANMQLFGDMGGNFNIQHIKLAPGDGFYASFSDTLAVFEYL